MFGSKVVALNVDEKLLGKLAELFGGEVADQVKGALKQAGVALPESEPEVKAEPEKAFGEMLSSDSKDTGWTGRYNVKGAQSLSVVANEGGNIVITGVNAEGQNVEIDVFYGEPEDATGDTMAWVEEGDTLVVTVPTANKATDGQEFTVEGFDSDEDLDEPSEDDWCEECQEYHG